MYTRYAIYAAPRPGALANFTAKWLGWDPVTGREVAHPTINNLPRPVEMLTQTPRRYGFHGTLKPPFRLAPGRTAGELGEAVAALAASYPVVDLQLEIAALADFVALRPVGKVRALDQLAARCVTQLDEFRARLTKAEVERRNPDRLTGNQRDMLENWGYPFVMSEFRFHMTLTGHLTNIEAKQVVHALDPHLTPLLHSHSPVTDLCVFAETLEGRFRLLHRYPLGKP